MHQEHTVVISVGGSLIVPDSVDTAFLRSFKEHIYTHIQRGYRFVIITGGGKTARRYQESANAVTPLTNEDLDWIGIHATRLNGHLLRSIFYDVAHPVIITSPSKLEDVREYTPVIIAAGWKPGHSTDFVAVEIARHLGARQLVNLSNIDYVYTSDPTSNPDARPIKDISWHDFRALLPEKWDPGLSSPFDPIAAQEAEAAGMEVAIINGDKMEEFDRFIAGESFLGTKIF